MFLRISNIVKILLFVFFLLTCSYSFAASEKTNINFNAENFTSTYSYITEFQASPLTKNSDIVKRKIDSGIAFLTKNNMKVLGVKHVVFFNTPNEKDKIYIRIMFIIDVSNSDSNNN